MKKIELKALVARLFGILSDKKNLKHVVPAMILVAGVTVSITIMNTGSRIEQDESEPVIPSVEVVRAQPETVRLSVSSQGTVLPKREIDLVAEVSGKVTYVAPGFATGGFFNKGELLLRVDPSDYELAVTRSEAGVAQAVQALEREKAESAQAKLEWQALGEGDASPLVLRKPQLAQAQASLKSAQANLREAKLRLERTFVRAPFDGRIRSKQADLGQFVGQGSAIARIYSTDVVEVRLPLTDRQLGMIETPFLHQGGESSQSSLPVTLRGKIANREHVWQGKVVRADGTIDTRSRVYYVIAEVEAPFLDSGEPGWAPLPIGLFVEADIEGREYQNVYRLPRSVLQNQNQVLAVEEGQVRFRDVEILRATPDEIIISSGISPNEQINTTILELAVDGMPVKVISDQSGMLNAEIVNTAKTENES